MAQDKETFKNLIQVGSSAIYYEFRNILVKGKDKFDLNPEFEDWPTAIINTKSVKGTMDVRPDPKTVGQYLNPDELAFWQDKMKDYIMGMNDLTADVFDMIAHRWLQTAKHKDEMVTITADELLKLRGLLPQKSGNYRGGFKKEKRDLIQKHIHILCNTWIYIDEIELPTIENGKRVLKRFAPRGPAIIISSVIDEVDENAEKVPYAWRIRPGDVFAPFFLDKAARQTAWMSQKALQFDPCRETWEKRLTRYIAYQWRVRHNQGNFINPIKVNTLLQQAIQTQVDPIHPKRTKARFEKALNKLSKHNVIKSWEYVDVESIPVGQKGWWNDPENGWIQSKIKIVPPTEILEAYSQLKTTMQVTGNKVVKSDTVDKISSEIRQIRKNTNLTLEQLSREIEEVTGYAINISTLSRIEKGRSKPRKKTVEILQQWLKRYR